jgi:hypothetical protein
MDSSALQSAIAGHAQSLGIFERVTGHEPKNSPGTGLSCAIYFARLGPARGSGLASSSASVVFVVRIYSNMLQEPQDEIDPAILGATDRLIAAYSGDFELGGLIRCVDIFGMAGTPISAQAGYLRQDETTYRTVDITLPLVVNDAWAESP